MKQVGAPKKMHRALLAGSFGVLWFSSGVLRDPWKFLIFVRSQGRPRPTTCGCSGLLRASNTKPGRNHVLTFCLRGCPLMQLFPGEQLSRIPHPPMVSYVYGELFRHLDGVCLSSAFRQAWEQTSERASKQECCQLLKPT